MSKTRSEQCPGRMTPVIDICVLLAKRETKLFSLLNAWAEQTPLLGKGGVDAPSRKIPVPLKGADGVVRANSKTILFEPTTPSAPDLVPSQHLCDGAATPPLPRSIQSCPAGQLHNSTELLIAPVRSLPSRT